MVDNFMTEWEQRERRPPLVLVDSYGVPTPLVRPRVPPSSGWRRERRA